MDLVLLILKMEISIEGLLEKINLKVMVICITRKCNVISKDNSNKAEVKTDSNKDQIIKNANNKW